MEAGAEAELGSLTVPIVLPVKVSSGPPIPSSDQQPSENQPAALWETGNPWPGPGRTRPQGFWKAEAGQWSRSS